MRKAFMDLGGQRVNVPSLHSDERWVQEGRPLLGIHSTAPAAELYPTLFWMHGNCNTLFFYYLSIFPPFTEC